MTDDAWFGVTPEPVAIKIAQHTSAHYLSVPSLRLPTLDSATSLPPSSPSHSPHESILIDAFAGAGGNTIAFALQSSFNRIIAIERSLSVLACAKHNAHVVYGVAEDRIEWVLGDCFIEVPRIQRAIKDREREGETVGRERAKVVVFASPPWGGVGYQGDGGVFDLWRMKPYGLGSLCSGMWVGREDSDGEGKRREEESRDENGKKGVMGGVVLYLPRTSDLRQIAGLITTNEKGEGWERVMVVHYCMKGASKVSEQWLHGELKW
jgi:hypothetical protein